MVVLLGVVIGARRFRENQPTMVAIGFECLPVFAIAITFSGYLTLLQL